MFYLPALPMIESSLWFKSLKAPKNRVFIRRRAGCIYRCAGLYGGTGRRYYRPPWARMRVVFGTSPIYTAGKRADKANLLAPNRFPVFAAGRGGDYTYHGPGQRVVYLMLDLRRRGRDLRKFVRQVEGWILAALSEFNVQAAFTTIRLVSGFRDPNWHPDARTRLQLLAYACGAG